MVIIGRSGKGVCHMMQFSDVSQNS